MTKEDRKLFTEKFSRDSIFVQTTHDDLTPWDRNRIVAVLLNETGIEYSLADKISSEIQKTIFTSGLEFVTSEFVRELVNAKLLEYKLDEAWEKNKRLGLSLYDVGSLLKFPLAQKPADANSPTTTSSIIADNIKRQFVISDLFDENLVKDHVAGKYNIHGLSYPDKFVEVFLNAEDFINFSFVSGITVIEKPKTGVQFIENLIKIHFLMSDYVIEGLHWFGIEQVLTFFKCDKNECSYLVEKFIDSISSISMLGTTYSIFLEKKENIKKAVELIEKKRFFNVEIKSKKENYFPSPYLNLYSNCLKNSLYVGEVVTINLPGFALDIVESRSSVEEKLEKILLNAVKIFSKKQLFIQKLSAVKPHGVLELLTKAGLNYDNLKFGIAINGLNEWSRILFNSNIDNLIAEEGAIDFLKKLKNKITIIAEQQKIKILLMSSAQENISYRFARMDLKFNSYTVSRIVNGSIVDSAIYYTNDCCLPSSQAVPIEEKIRLESYFQSFFDFPFRIELKSLNSNILNVLLKNENIQNLFLTYDFSLCYNCKMISQGVYQTCPECFGTEIEVYSCSHKGYVPLSRLNSAFKDKVESYFYYI